MTELDLYDKALIEQNKLEAPTLLIDEYNYLINKAITQYINLTYARFDINQQSSDDLRWLQRSTVLNISSGEEIIHPMESKFYSCALPNDYFHMLNCTVYFKPTGKYPGSLKCPKGDDENGGIYSMCRRLTADQFPAIVQNAYLKPTIKRPYYYINLTKKEDAVEGDGKVILPMEIRCGKNDLYEPEKAYIDYLKQPREIKLTWEQVNGSDSNIQDCEFPDAVAYEIINIFVKLLLENAGDPRFQTHFAINQTVGNLPTQENKV